MLMKIAVLGAGTWGMALARLLFLNGNEVFVWSKLPEEVEILSRERVHKNLPGMTIPDGIVFTSDIVFCLNGAGLVVFAVPSVFVRSTAGEAAAYLDDEVLICDAAKGLEARKKEGYEEFLTMSRVIEEELKNAGVDNTVVALSGPTHAEEVALDMPTAIVSACGDMDRAKKIQNIFANSFFRVYTNDDILGVELCGAAKNVLALAAGIARGMGYGDNAMAAIITRGIEELRRLGVAMGAKERTFSGLTGTGDLIVTATSMHSRNNRCGMLIGQGMSVDEAVKSVGMVVEGINALPAVAALARKFDVDMPITFILEDLTADRITSKEALSLLMDRDMKSE